MKKFLDYIWQIKMDIKHVSFLLKNFIKGKLTGDEILAEDSFCWLKIHFKYDGKWIDNKDRY